MQYIALQLSYDCDHVSVMRDLPRAAPKGNNKALAKIWNYKPPEAAPIRITERIKLLGYYASPIRLNAAQFFGLFGCCFIVVNIA